MDETQKLSIYYMAKQTKLFSQKVKGHQVVTMLPRAQDSVQNGSLKLYTVPFLYKQHWLNPSDLKVIFFSWSGRLLSWWSIRKSSGV